MSYDTILKDLEQEYFIKSLRFIITEYVSLNAFPITTNERS